MRRTVRISVTLPAAMVAWWIATLSRFNFTWSVIALALTVVALADYIVQNHLRRR